MNIIIQGTLALPRLLLTLLFILLCVPMLVLTALTAHAAKPLPATQAFVPSVSRVNLQTIDIHIDILPHYYLYRERRLSLESSNDALVINDIALSPGIDKNDAFFGTQSVWYGGKNAADISIAYDNPQQLTQTTLILAYQGCQDGVICYPPQRIELPISLPVDTNNNISTSQGLFKGNNRQIASQAVKASELLPSAKKSLLLKDSSNNSQTILSEDQAFPFSIEAIDATTLQLRFLVANGYYLYRDKIKLTADDLSDLNAPSPLADVAFGSGEEHSDAFYGKQIVYRGESTVANIYLQRPVAELALHLQFQGCAEKGICYPVMNREVRLQNGFVSAVTIANDKFSENLTDSSASNSASNGQLLDTLSDTLRNNLWAGVGLLLLAGVALSFTPCVLPMLPILLGIVTNQRKVSKPRALLLSSAYALGVAVMMAVFGLVVAKTGVNIQIIFQQPLWLIMFAGIFIAMGLAMLGMFNLAMPNSVQSRVIVWQNRLQNSHVGSLFVVGALSTLIVGPCVAPPLIAVLAFISTTGDSILGAVYLFALGLGMSLPLVIFSSLVTTIPRTGALSRLVTRIFAMLMFGVGLWLLGRLLSGALTLGLWGVFMIMLAVLFWRSGFITAQARYTTSTLAVSAFLLGGIWLTGGLMGNSNPFKPFTTAVKLPFTAVSDDESLQKALRESDKPVILDLYADWCVSCQEVEHFTLTDPQVISELKKFTRLKLDISQTTAAHRHLLKELDLIGPPAMLFFNSHGREQRDKRHIGAIKAKTLLKTLNAMQTNK